MDLFHMVESVRKAALPIKNRYMKSLVSELKDDGTPVTDVDIEIHNNLMAWTSQFNSVGYIGEEGNSFKKNCTSIIYVDPLDGTDSYERGLPVPTVVMTVMGLWADGLWYPTLAVICNPITDFTWSGSYNPNQRIYTSFVRTPTKNKTCKVVTDRSPSRITVSTWPNAPFNLEEMERVVNRDKRFNQQQFGSIAFGAGLIASGTMDATIFAGTSAVETVAMSLIVRGAGGVATDLFGEPLGGYELAEQNGKLDFILPRGAIMSSSQELTDQLVKIVRSVQ